MFYKLLGMFVWRGAKLFLRRKYGRTYVPVPLLAALLIHARRGSDDLI